MLARLLNPPVAVHPVRATAAFSMVVPATSAPVVLHRQPAFGERIDVIDLASLGGDIAGDVRALTVADEHRRLRRAPEDPLAHADVEHT